MGVAEEGVEEYNYGTASLEKFLFCLYDSFKELYQMLLVRLVFDEPLHGRLMKV